MNIDVLDEYLSQWIDPNTGLAYQTSAHREGDWRAGVVETLSPPTANILGEGIMPIRFRNVALSSVSVGDPIVFQKLGPVWIAVYQVEKL